MNFFSSKNLYLMVVTLTHSSLALLVRIRAKQYHVLCNFILLVKHLTFCIYTPNFSKNFVCLS